MLTRLRCVIYEEKMSITKKQTSKKNNVDILFGIHDGNWLLRLYL